MDKPQIERWAFAAAVMLLTGFPLLMQLFDSPEARREAQRLETLTGGLYLVAIESVRGRLQEPQFPMRREASMWCSGSMWVVSFEPRSKGADGAEMRSRATVVFDVPESGTKYHVTQVLLAPIEME